MKSDFHKFCTAVLGLALGTLFTVLTMIHGWGVQPKSWGWILGINVTGQLVAWSIARSIEKD